jgi:hypothetical protein
MPQHRAVTAHHSSTFTLRAQRSYVDTVAQASIAALFRLVTLCLVRPRVSFEPGARLEPRTVVVFSHKRDIDIPALVYSLFAAPFGARWIGCVTFIGRADIYVPGFLGLYYPQLPRALRRWLFLLDIGGILRMLRIVPARTAGPRTIADWLRDLSPLYPPDTPLGALLSADGLARAAYMGVPPELPLGAVFAWRYEEWLGLQVGPEVFSSEVMARLRVREAREVPHFLAVAREALREGGILVIAPEGQLSPDGRMQSFRGGLHYLLRDLPDASILPVGFTYDLLGHRRPVLFICVGALRPAQPELPRRVFDERLRADLARLGTVTLAHIVARIVFDELGEGTATIATAELARRAWRSARTLARTGRRLDPALTERKRFAARFAQLLRAARGRGLDVHDGEIGIDWPLLRQPVNGWLENPLGYAYNESRDLPAWSGQG